MRLDDLDGWSGKKAVLAASVGGHLSQLVRLSKRIGFSNESLWVTFDHPQSRSLLAEARVLFIPYIKPRQLGAVVSGAVQVKRVVHCEPFDVALSTGSGIALSVLPVSRLAGIPSAYVESVSRVHGPSVTGRLLAAFGGTHLFTQNRSWANEKWKPIAPVLDDYIPVNVPQELPRNPHVFITLGTMESFRFDALVDKVIDVLPSNAIVKWQIGCTTRQDLPGSVRSTIAAAEFDSWVSSSDVVISHAGAGSALRILELGKMPVLVPRRARRHEHIDDHQEQIASELNARGLAVVSEVEKLNWHHLETAARTRIAPSTPRGLVL